MKKYSLLQLLLTVLFVVCLLISNVITGKQIQLPFDIVMTGAVFIFPITYILSDVFSEVYGYSWSRFTRYLGFVANVFMVIIFQLLIVTPSPDYWLNQEAFEIVLGNTPRVLIASLLAYLIGDYINDKVFKKMKEKHKDNHEGFGSRAIISSLLGELTDSMIFIPLAFIGQMPIETLIEMGIIQVSIKTAYEFVALPITKTVVKNVSAYEKMANKKMA